VLVCHALSGDAHAAGRHAESDARPGWWDVMIGPRKGIDTDRYFVICSNILGGCKGTTGPSTINPETGKRWGLDFPVITVEDMVRVQKRLIEHLGIETLLGVIGGSLGGMQVLEWAVRYPDSVRVAIPIATADRLNAQAIAFDAVGRNAILADADFNDGRYSDQNGPDRGLAIARMVGHITYLSEEGMHQKFGRELRAGDTVSYDFDSEFSVEGYLDHQGRSFVERFDANSYLYITKAMDYYDLAGRYGSLRAAFEQVRAKFLVISFSSDWLFTSKQSRRIVDALLASGVEVSYSEVRSDYGHDAFLLEPETLGRLVGGILEGGRGRPLLEAGGAVEPYRQPPAVETAWAGRRGDHDCIESLVEPGSTVLDLGCGRGALLSRLMSSKNVRALGVEVQQENICECIDRGVPVVDLDVEEELSSFGDKSFDYVLLSQTLQTLHRPDAVIREMLRIGRRCIVSFPNFVYWRSVLQIILTGRTPVTENLPFRWYDTPIRHYVTLRDFRVYCRENGVRILDCLPLKEGRSRPLRLLPSMRAEEAIFVITDGAGR
jgi:homoserine O-acetyltransferase